MPLLGKWRVFGYEIRRAAALVRPGPPPGGPRHPRRQHPRRHQNVERQQREYVAQKLDLKQLQKNKRRHGPRQQQPVRPLRQTPAPGQPRRERRPQPNRNPQRQPQSPYRSLANLIPKRRRICVLPGKRPVPGRPRHFRLCPNVLNECRPVQQGIRRGNEKYRQASRSRQCNQRQNPRRRPRRKAAPIPPGPVFGHPQKCQQQRQYDGRRRYFRRQRQPGQRPQQQRVPPPPPVNQPQHRPQRPQRRQHAERLRPVKMSVLNVNHRKGRAGRRRQSRPRPVHPPPQHIHHPHRRRIRQGRQPPPDKTPIHRPPVRERLGYGTNQHQRVNQRAAQGKPVRIERAALGGQRRPEIGYARLHTRPFRRPPLVARRQGKRAEHIVRPQVERPLVGMKPLPPVPVNPVKTQRQRRQQQRGQQQIRPPQPTQGGRDIGRKPAQVP